MKFALSVFFFNCMLELCFTESDSKEAIEKFKAIKATCLDDIKKSQSPTITFGSQIKNVCPKMPKKYLRQNEEKDSCLLGAGSYGQVFSFSPDYPQQVFKVTNFKEYLENSLYKKFDKLKILKGFQMTCVSDIHKIALKQKFFADPESNTNINTDPKDPIELKTIDPKKLHIHELQPIRFDLLESPLCSEIKDHKNIAAKTIKQYFNLSKKEIKSGQMYSNFSKALANKGLHPPYPMFGTCYISQELDVYFTMEKLSYTLKDIIVRCPTTIFGLNLENKLKIMLQILNQVYLIHLAYMTHCDIKPANIVFKNENCDFVHLIDFGFLTEELCTGGSPLYSPFEAFSKKIKVDDTDPITLLFERQKHDSFSLGMTFLEFELIPQSFKAFKEEYSKLKSEKEEDIQKEENTNKMFQTVIDEVLNSSYPSKKTKDEQRQYEIQKGILDVIIHLLQFDYKKRIHVGVAYYQILQLYKAFKSPTDKIPELTTSRMKKREKLKDEMFSYPWLEEYNKILGSVSTKMMI